jgi:hypothetical protein
LCSIPPSETIIVARGGKAWVRDEGDLTSLAILHSTEARAPVTNSRKREAG